MFTLAYDLPLQANQEVVFVKADDWHRKVRVLLTEVDGQGDRLTLTGHSYGSSYSPIKAAKKDEPPVVVKGEWQRTGQNWHGTLEMVR